jgi:hypothetical protein
MATKQKGDTNTAMRRTLVNVVARAEHESIESMQRLREGIEKSPPNAIEWCEQPLSDAVMHDYLAAVLRRMDSNVVKESQQHCVESCIRWLRDAILIHATGGRSTSIFHNAVEEARMRGYAHALRLLEFVLEQGGEG